MTIETSEQALRRQGWFEVAVVLSLTAVPYALRSLGIFASHATDTKLTFAEYAVRICLQSLTVILTCLYIISRSKDGWAGYGLVKFRALRDTLVGGAVFLSSTVVWYVTWTFFMIPLMVLGVESSRAIVTGFQFPIPQTPVEIGLLIVLGAVNGLGEELSIRSFLVVRMESLTAKPWVAVLVPNLLFGLYHTYQGVLPALSVGIWGLICSLTFRMTKSLWPLVIGHALVDIIGLLVRR